MSLFKGVESMNRLSLPSAQWRLVIGAVQGIALGALTLLIAHKIVPFTYPVVARPLKALLVLLPILLLLDMGRMRSRWLIVLMIVEGLIAGSVALHDILHFSLDGSLELLAGPLFFLLIFIVQVMAFAADRDRSWRPQYATLFEVAWDQGILLALATFFTTLAWGILWLASALFAAIGLSGIGYLLRQPIIFWPITTMTFAGAIALCIDVETMIWGARRLVLSLLSMLLPIIGWLSAVFLTVLIAVPHTGSWPVHTAGWSLSFAATVIILLLNALIQDGRQTQSPGRLMQISGRVAAAVILPLVILALEPLGVRIAAHGWTVERMLAAVLLGILTLYGIGYLGAAVRPSRWFATIAFTNVVVAAFSAVVFLMLLTAIADPRRLSALDQVARLRNGTSSPADFPYLSLARDYGQYGRNALQNLIDTPPSRQGAAVQFNARAALAAQSGIVTPGNYDQVTMHPQGATLPDDLKAAALTPDFSHNDCLRSVQSRCDVVVFPAATDGINRIMIFGKDSTVEIFVKKPGQIWRRESEVFIYTDCRRQRDALLNGQAVIGAITLPALIVGGARYPLMPSESLCGI